MTTPEQLQAIIPILAAGVLAFALILMLASLRLFRKSRKDIYWRQRRMAGQRGWRLFLWSIGLVMVSGILCAATSVAGLLYVHPTKTPTAVANAQSPLDVPTLTPTRLVPSPSATLTSLPPTITPTNTEIPPTVTLTQTATLPLPTQPTVTTTASITVASPTVIPTVIPTEVLTAIPPTLPTTESTAASTPTLTETLELTPTPTEMLTETPTPTSTLTPIPSATLTLAPTSSPTLLGGAVALESSVTPNPDARITINALDIQISGDFGPVKPATSFSAGFTRIYYFVTFSGMEKGVLWRRELLLDDQVIQSNQYLWGLTQGGTAYFFFGQEEGFKPGSYRINLYIGSSTKPTGMVAFTVS